MNRENVFSILINLSCVVTKKSTLKLIRSYKTKAITNKYTRQIKKEVVPLCIITFVCRKYFSYGTHFTSFFLSITINRLIVDLLH